MATTTTTTTRATPEAVAEPVISWISYARTWGLWAAAFVVLLAGVIALYLWVKAPKEEATAQAARVAGQALPLTPFLLRKGETSALIPIMKGGECLESDIGPLVLILHKQDGGKVEVSSVQGHTEYLKQNPKEKFVAQQYRALEDTWVRPRYIRC